MNTTTLKADQYDKSVHTSIPLYAEIHSQIIDLAAHCGFTPVRWLDAGCGTGSFVAKCMERFPETSFVLSDPSPDMLSLARERFAENGRIDGFHEQTSDRLDLPDDSLCLVTAILSHHYLSREERKATLENCRRMLAAGGMYVAVEHVAAFTDKGRERALARWRDYQISAGKTPEKADHHLSRYGEEFFPINPAEHLDVLKQAGFAVAEFFWYSYSQIGVYAIK